MELSREDILQAIENMTVMDVVGLVKAMEEKFGVSSASMMQVAPDAASEAAAEEKNIFDIVLTSSGDKKIAVIKVVRAFSGLGLKEAKDKVDQAPCTLKEGVTKDEAESIKKDLEEAGATVELK